MLELAPSPHRGRGEGSATATRTRTLQRHHRAVWWLAYLAVMAGGLVIVAVALTYPGRLHLGFGLASLMALLVLWILHPKAALATTVLLTLVGDQVTTYWYPFTKNLSSSESVMYLSEGIPLSPLEIVLGVALCVVLLRNLAEGRVTRPAPLLAPMAVFAFAALFGLAWGLRRGGDLDAALFELRPVLYLPLLYLLVINVCEDRGDHRRMMWAALTGITIQSVLSVQAIWAMAPDERPPPDSIMEHGSAIGINLAFLLLLAALTLRKVPALVPVLLAIGSLAMVPAYFLSERRAAVIALGVGIVVLFVALFARQRRTFWRVVPPVLLIATVYVAAMWGSESGVAFPAQAVKSVLAPEEVGEEDRSSTEYREIENYNLHATVRSAPVTGIGFGIPFHRPVPLPALAQFAYQDYIPHNSLLWLWTKLGFVGFASWFYLVGRTLLLGAERLRGSPEGADTLVMVGAVAFIAMFSVFMYVDIAWGARNMLLLALAMATCVAPLRDESPVSA